MVVSMMWVLDKNMDNVINRGSRYLIDGEKICGEVVCPGLQLKSVATDRGHFSSHVL